MIHLGDTFGAYSQNTRVYRYNGSTFVDSKIDYLLQSVQHGAMAVGDIDNDHDMDCIVLGEASYTTPAIAVYKNNMSNAWNIGNKLPSAPMNLRTEILPDNKVRLSWDPASDPETGDKGLTYNIYFVQKNDTLIMPASHWDGYRKIVGMGNVQHNTSITLNNHAMAGNYTWAVQAIDKSYQGGPFSAKQNFIVTSVEEHAGLVEFFPNPVQNALTLRTVKPVDVTVYNSTGILMWQTTVSDETNVPVNTWSDGLYIIKYVANGRTWTEKIIKD